MAVRKDVADKALATGDKMASCRNIAYTSMEIDEDVFIHPSSVVFHDTPPEWVVFQEVVRTSRVYVKGRCIELEKRAILIMKALQGSP